MAREELFKREDQAPSGAQVWVGGHLESSEVLGEAFLRSADILAAAWRNDPHASADQLALPIVQNYRHAIELCLKAGCEKTAELVGISQTLGYGQDTRRADLANRLGSTHSIAQLVTLLNDLLGGLEDSGAGRLPTETAKVLSYLHDLDHQGTAFRYASRRVGKRSSATWEPVRPSLALLDLDNAATELHDAASMLLNGLMTYLDVYEQWLQEMQAEYRSNLESY